MKVHADMDLPRLVSLMGERHGIGRLTSRSASIQEARELRDLLVRDFNGSDTDSIDGATWHAYCCAVDPNEAN